MKKLDLKKLLVGLTIMSIMCAMPTLAAYGQDAEELTPRRDEVTKKAGYVDSDGNVVIPFRYDNTKPFSEGLGAVALNGKWGFVDTGGNEVIPCRYKFADSFKNGKARVAETNLNQSIFIDTSGQQTTPGGKMSDDITWQVENGTLVISGTGGMPTVFFATMPDWIDLSSVLTSIVIEDGITSMGKNTFLQNYKNVTSVTIGENLTSIDTYSFMGCKNLSVVEVRAIVPPTINNAVFQKIGKAKLVVPAGAKAAYEADKFWRKFGTIEER
jgi:hypothetical protein